MVEFLGSAWLQVVLWFFAAGMAFYFYSFMKGSNGAWTLIAFGVLLYGSRIGYKLLPFYEQTQVVRYLIGIVGLIFLFLGLLKYCNTTLKSLGRG